MQLLVVPLLLFAASPVSCALCIWVCGWFTIAFLSTVFRSDAFWFENLLCESQWMLCNNLHKHLVFVFNKCYQLKATDVLSCTARRRMTHTQNRSVMYIKFMSMVAIVISRYLPPKGGRVGSTSFVDCAFWAPHPPCNFPNAEIHMFLLTNA